MALWEEDRVASLYVDPDDFKGVHRAVDSLQADFVRASGRRPAIVTSAEDLTGTAVIIGSIGRSAVVDRLIAEGRIDVSAVRGRWEAWHIELVAQPVAGVDQALVIAGSDKRGTIFGVYDLSEQIGVSPWYWWADVPVRQSPSLYVKAGTRLHDAPTVRYRGIFLNDEAPALTGWVQENFGNYNHAFYEHVFELLLRLKSNFLWPAMWNNAFADDDPRNIVLADEYGIVMGTSHHEPMMRADKEWDRHGTGPWDYARNAENLYPFWLEGARRNRPYESIYTLGMRGQRDTPMSETEDVDLLQRIVADQREILAEVFDDRDLAEVPQVWALYKEVQGYYESGMRVPDDVILLWCDDNWGNIRRLPTPAERTRAGGAGVYYHFDYVGGPRSYRWINTIQLAKIWEQMNLAHRYGANRIWLTNVGDLKPMELPIEFFLDLAWDIGDWPRERMADYTRLWAGRNFGESHAEEIAALLDAYTRHNARRKPELQDAATWSLLHYREAERLEQELSGLVAPAEALYAAIEPEYRSAYYQLVYYPVRASAVISQMYIAQARNHLYAAQGRASANAWAERTRDWFELNRELADRFHGEATGGKWNHMMAQPRIGYIYWNNPPADTPPPVVLNQPNAVADMGVAVEGMAQAWPADSTEYALPPFWRSGAGRHYIEVFNRGTEPFEFSITPSEAWIQVDSTGGRLTEDRRVFVSIDWNGLPAGTSTGTLTVRGASWGPAAIAVTAHNPSAMDLQGFVEADGYVSIDAPNFSRKRDAEGLAWDVIPGLGRADSSIAVFPVTDRSFADDPAAAPWVEYDLTLFSAGEVVIETLWSPTWPLVPGRGLRFGLAMDGAEPQVLDLHEDRAHHLWQESVRTGVRAARTPYRVPAAGRHTLRIFGIDPAATLQKIIIDTGGLKPSYLGPPQSSNAGS